MNCLCDLPNRRLDASDIAHPLERVRHLDSEVDVHGVVPVFRMVIQEQVVSRAHSASHFQERPHLIERRLPARAISLMGTVARTAATSSACAVSTAMSYFIGVGVTRWRQHRKTQ